MAMAFPVRKINLQIQFTFLKCIQAKYQIALAHRKPRWVPVAKSRIYRIPARPEIPIEEKLELKRLNDNYHTQMRAIRKFYHTQMMLDKESKENATSVQSLEQERIDYDVCVKINDEWNSAIAKERELRLVEERKQMEAKAFERIKKRDKVLQDQIDKANELIRKEKLLSETFITRDTLDEAIQHALANPVDYNYAIDLKGNKYMGRDANSTLEENKN